MAADDGRLSGLELVGGRPSLDFSNTVGWHDSEEPSEWLHDAGDLVSWLVRAGLLDGAAEAALRADVAAWPAAAEALLERGRALREAIYRVLSPVAAGEAAPAAALAELNEWLAPLVARSRLVAEDGGFAWAWSGEAHDLNRALWPVARDAAELLTSDELDRVRECGGPGCGWLFVDTSRNRSRRWCSMADCGNRAKARRHYHRQKAAREG